MEGRMRRRATSSKTKSPNAHLIARREAFQQFRREYLGTVCSACESEKWAKSPFCRLCSIRLSRAHLFAKFTDLLGEYANHKFVPYRMQLLVKYWRHYETCRDFLIQKRRSA